VERVALTGLGVRIVQLITDDPDAARCPGCRVRSTSGKDWVLTRPHDLPSGGGPVAVQWRKRQWRCRTEVCPRASFTEQVAQVPAGMRTTTRLRTALAVAVEDGRDQSEVAAWHGVSWPTVQRAVAVHGAVELAEPEPVAAPGSVGETGFVDITGDQALLGQVDGRSSAAVQAWLAARTPEFRAGVEVVVIDPHAGYVAAVRAALPDAQVAVDHFHLILLANKAVTAVRQRVTRDLLDRRGRKTDPTWANRRLLLRGREHLSERALARMWNGCIDHDPTGQILSAWIAKEELRALCATATRGGHPSEIRDRLHAFHLSRPPGPARGPPRTPAPARAGADARHDRPGRRPRLAHPTTPPRASKAWSPNASTSPTVPVAGPGARSGPGSPPRPSSAVSSAPSPDPRR
jgi:hypothetical protein